MTVVIVDYGSGNLRSAQKAFERVSGENGRKICVSNEVSDVLRASHIVLPGVGAFADCKRGIDALPGMRDALQESVIEREVPFLGICVGMQLMASIGHENGLHEGFNWINGEVVAIKPKKKLKIPHMGWNDITVSKKHLLLDGLGTGSHLYFVHSFHMQCLIDSEVIATVDYGETISAVVHKKNMVGTQFHPEKSQAVGLRFISNFLGYEF